MFKINFLIFVLSCWCFSFAYCCQLNVRHPYPLLSKNFGSKIITFRGSEKGVTFNKGESVQVYCGSGLIINYNGYDLLQGNQYQTALMFCDENGFIEARGIYQNIRASEIYVQCSPSYSESLYESKRKLPNCERSVSYVIGKNIPFLRTIKKLAMCYDLDNFALKYANYVAYKKKDVLISPEDHFDSDLEVDLEQRLDNLGDYFHFMSQSSFNSSRDQQQNAFFNAFEFDYDTIIQDEPLNNKFDSWKYILNTMWWRQLRQNNWRFFLDALKGRTMNNSIKYRVYVGTYGNATLPATESCHGQSEAVAVQSDGLTVTAPLYIWAYLESLSPGNEDDFVIIAHNSPYSQAPDHTEFCGSDICDDILWLKDSRFGRHRRIPTFGYTFCCRAEEVAKVIDYFPLATRAIETSTAAAAGITSQ